MLLLLQDFDRNQQISALNGKQFFLVDVIAHILHHLKDRLLTEVRDFGYKDLQASDINWVITVPAFWKSGGKSMMREAGYMVSPTSIYKSIITRARKLDMLVEMHRFSGKAGRFVTISINCSEEL